MLYLARMMNRFMALIVCIAVALPASAQQLALKTYTRGTGLASDYILSLFQDRRGFLWIGTDRGVSRYDGVSFRTFTTENGLPSNLIYCITQANDGAMWFGTYEGGASRFDGTSFQTLTTADGLPSNSVSAIAEDSFGRLFFETASGIAMKRGNSFFKVFNRMGANRPMLRLRNGSIIVSDSIRAYEIVPSNDDRIDRRQIPIETRLSIGFGKFNTTAAIERVNGEIVMVCNDGILLLRRSGTQWTARKQRGAYEKSLGIAEDRAGRLWMAGQFGLARIQGNSATVFGNRHGIDPEFIQALLADREGVLWLGTFGGGLKRLAGDHLRTFTTREGLLSNNVNTIAPDSKGRIWIGTKRLANVIVEEKIHQVRFDAQFSDEQVRSFGETADGKLHLGCFNHLYVIAPLPGVDFRAARDERFQNAHSGIAAMYSPPGSNQLWLGTYGDGVIHDAGSDIRLIGVNSGLVSNMIETITPSRSGIWFLSRNNGATLYLDGHMRSFTESEGLPSRMLYCVQEDGDGTIWFGTNKGLVRLRDGKIRLLSRAEGLVGTAVLGIVRDPSEENASNTWVVSDKALHCLLNDSLLSYASCSILPSEETSINQVTFQASTRRLWLATTEGAVRIDLADVRRLEVAPLVHIATVTVNDAPVYDELSTVMSANGLHLETLSPDRNNVSISFASTSFIRTGELRYRFRLDGADAEWSEPTRERIVRYRNLTEGVYTFSVTAINPDGNQSSEAATYAFTIPPPFWRSWWFVVLAGVSLFGLIMLAVRMSTERVFRKRLEALKREREILEDRQRTRDHIARDLHDDLASTVGSAGMFVETAKRTLQGESEPARGFLEKAASLLTEAEDAMSDIVWSVSPKHDSLQSLVTRIELVTTDLCRARNLQFTIEVTGVPEQATMDLQDEIRRNVYLVFKEAISNSLRHGQASRVWVRIELDRRKLTLSVSDDGVGFAAEEDGKPTMGGHGVHNMRKRADEIGASLSIQSVPGQGTTITLRAEIPQMGD